MDLTDRQWEPLAHLLPDIPRRADGRGRPWRSSRACLDGILWMLRTGAQWKELPHRYPPYQTVHRRYLCWAGNGALERAIDLLATDLGENGEGSLADCYASWRSMMVRRGASGGTPGEACYRKSVLHGSYPGTP